MSLRILAGRAGSGKTYACIEQIRAELRSAPTGPPLVWLVPERATLSAERALYDAQVTGSARAQVLGFYRFARLVLREPAPPGPLAQSVLLAEVLQEDPAAFGPFCALADRPGFLRTLLRTFEEVAAYGLDRPQAAEAALPERLRVRLEALRLALERWRTRLQARGFLDPTRVIDRAGEAIAAAPADWAEAQVWVDGFAAFTPVEWRLLERLASSAKQVTITACVDPEGASPVFADARALLARLTQLPGAQVSALGAPKRFTPPLAELEDALCGGPPASGAGLSCTAWPTQEEEVAAAARRIVALCRDHGFAAGEIAVVTSNLATYAEPLARRLAEAGIPAHIDGIEPLVHHPLVQFLRALLGVLGEGFTAAACGRLLKSDLLGIGRDEADELEFYLWEHALGDEQWRDPEPWTYATARSFDEDESPGIADLRVAARMDGLRRQVLAVVEPVAALWRGERRPTVAEAATELCRVLDATGVLSRAARLPDAQAVWRQVSNLLEQWVAAAGERPVALERWLETLDDALAGLRRSRVPAHGDGVTIGSIERSRHGELRALFVLGADEGFLLPQPHEGLLTETDREALFEQGIACAPPLRARLGEAAYLGYIACTRARERLWVSRTLADLEGRPLGKGPLWRQLEAALVAAGEREAAGARAQAGEPAAGVQAQVSEWKAAGGGRESGAAGAGPKFGDWPSTVQDALERIVPSARAGASVEQAALAAFARVEFETAWRRATHGLRYRNRAHRLPADLVRALYGEELHVSPSRLRTAAACAFQHYGRYGLRLQPPPAPELERYELGELIHAALLRLTERMDAAPPDASPPLAAWIAEAVDALAPRLRAAVAAPARRRVILRQLRRQLLWASRALWLQRTDSGFVTQKREWTFGGDQAAPRLAGARLRGRVDRIDVAESDGRRLLRVVDYKSYRASWEARKLLYGLDLQLPLYAWAAQEAFAAEPAGWFYAPVYAPLSADGKEPLAALRFDGPYVDRPDVVAALDRRLAAGATSRLVKLALNKDGGLSRRSGEQVSERQLAAAIDWARRRAEESIAAIRAGETAIAPYELGRRRPCEFCDFRPVCRFDPAHEGGAIRRLPAVRTAKVWAQMVADDASPVSADGAGGAGGSGDGSVAAGGAGAGGAAAGGADSESAGGRT